MSEKRGNDIGNSSWGKPEGKKRLCVDCINFKCRQFDKHNARDAKKYGFQSLRRLFWALQNHFQVWFYFCKYKRTLNEYYVSVELKHKDDYVSQMSVKDCEMFDKDLDEIKKPRLKIGACELKRLNLL